MRINLRRDISAVGNVDDKSYKISKHITRLLRHQGYPREDLCLSRSPWRTEMDGANTDRQPGEVTTRKDFSVVCTPTATFSTCGRSKATLEGTKLIIHCKITWKSRTIGLSTSVTLVLLMTPILFCPIRSGCRRQRYERRRTNGILHRRGSCEWTTRGGSLWREKTTKGTLQNKMERCMRTQHIGSMWKVLKTKD